MKNLFEQLRKYSIHSSGALLCYGFALFFSLYSWQPLLHASWSMIDDHEIISTIGPRERLPFSEIPEALSKTEVGKDATLTRFRPSYYSLRFIEAASWGKQPMLWYATRILIAVFFALTLTAICLHLGGPILTFGFLAFELSRPYWSYIFACLGPAETYAVLGLTLVALGVIVGVKKRWGLLACAAIAIGIAIAAGSKENFIILSALPIWLIFSRKVRVSAGVKTLLVAVLIYLAWIAVTVLHRVISAGKDIYSNPATIESRLQLLTPFFLRSDVLAWLFVCVLLAIFFFLSKHGDDKVSAEFRRIYSYAMAIFLMLLVFATQFVFYFGQWPDNTEPRYLFPGILVKHMSIFLLIAIVHKVMCLKFPRVNRLQLVSLLGALCFLFATFYNDERFFSIKKFREYFLLESLSTNRMASLQMVSSSNLFFSRIEDTVRFLKMHPTMPVIVNSHSWGNYEPIFSVQRYIKSYGLDNPIALNIVGYSITNVSAESEGLRFQLTQVLENLELLGGSGFVSINTLQNNVDCFSFGMSGPPLATCMKGIVIWP